MNIFEIAGIFWDKLAVIDYLQWQNIVYADVRCTTYQIRCALVKQSDKQCKICRSKKFVLKDSFREGSSKLSHLNSFIWHITRYDEHHYISPWDMWMLEHTHASSGSNTCM